MIYRKKILLSLFLICAILPLLPSEVRAQDTSLQDILDRGTIKIATSSGYTPFEDYDAVEDELYGFDIALGEYIGVELGVNVTWSDVAFSTILLGLDTGDIDCVLAAVSITPEREASVDFSRWYFESEQAVLVSLENPKNITEVGDLNVSTIDVGYQTGTTSNWYVLDVLTGCTDVSYETVPLAIAALQSGTIDAVLCDLAVAMNAVNQNDDLQYVDTFSKEYFGIPVKTGADALRNRLDEILDDLLGDDIDNPDISADYNEMYEEWIGAPAPGYEDVTIPGFPIVGLISAVSIGFWIVSKKFRK